MNNQDKLSSGAIYAHRADAEYQATVVACHDDRGVLVRLADTDERQWMTFEYFRRNYSRISP